MRVNPRHMISTSTHLPGESYHRQLKSFGLCSCNSFQALIVSLPSLTLHKHYRPLSVSDYEKYLLLTNNNNNKNHASLCCDECPPVRPSMTNTFSQRLKLCMRVPPLNYTFVPLFVTFALFQGYRSIGKIELQNHMCVFNVSIIF